VTVSNTILGRAQPTEGVMCYVVMDDDMAVNGELFMIYKEGVIICLGCYVRIFLDGKKKKNRNISE
jgi:hypothetical protein